jgi:DNA adenine methylase
MRNCNHKWLIAFDDSEYIKELFSFANVIAWDLTFGMRNVTESSNQKGKELFISNYLEHLPEKQQLLLFEPKINYSKKIQI